MRDNNRIGPWIRRFLLEHMVAERNLARNTQLSYRDTLVLLLPFAARNRKTPIDRLTVEEISPAVVRLFLEHLEKERNCCGATRNLRLGAIHALAKFIGLHSPEHLAWCTEIRTVPFRKVSQPTMAYLDKPEMEAILSAWLDAHHGVGGVGVVGRNGFAESGGSAPRCPVSPPPHVLQSLSVDSICERV